MVSLAQAGTMRLRNNMERSNLRMEGFVGDLEQCGLQVLDADAKTLGNEVFIFSDTALGAIKHLGHLSIGEAD